MQYSSSDLRLAWPGIKTMARINQCVNATEQSINLNGVDDSNWSNTFNKFFSLSESSEFWENVSKL